MSTAESKKLEHEIFCYLRDHGEKTTPELKHHFGIESGKLWARLRQLEEVSIEQKVRAKNCRGGMTPATWGVIEDVAEPSAGVDNSEVTQVFTEQSDWTKKPRLCKRDELTFALFGNSSKRIEIHEGY